MGSLSLSKTPPSSKLPKLDHPPQNNHQSNRCPRTVVLLCGVTCFYVHFSSKAGKVRRSVFPPSVAGLAPSPPFSLPYKIIGGGLLRLGGKTISITLLQKIPHPKHGMPPLFLAAFDRDLRQILGPNFPKSAVRRSLVAG